MSDINEFLGDIKQEGSDPFAEIVKDTQVDSPTTEEPKVEEPKEGDVLKDDNVPFHKHPRWIERENELKTLREQQEENAKVIAELSSLKDEIKPKATVVPEWFKELYGDNEIAYQKYSEHHQKEVEDIEQNLIKRQEDQRIKATQETQKWDKWVTDEIGKLRSEGKEFDENKLKKVMLDYSPTDTNNNLDFQKGYKIYEALETKVDNTEKSSARKELADKVSGTSKGDKPVKDYMTPADLRNKSWGNIV
jgi:hypothetical protein